MASKIGPTERQSAGAAAGSDDSYMEQLRAAFKEFERTSQQSEPVEDLHGSDDQLDQQLRAVVEERVGLQPNPVEEDEPVERDELRPGITSYLDHEALERKAIYDRLVAIENATAACASSGEMLPPLGLGAMLPVACRRCIHLIAELGLTSNQSAASRRDAPDSTASTTRSRNSKEHGFGIDPPSRIRINAASFNYPSLPGNPDSTQPKSALVKT